MDVDARLKAGLILLLLLGWFFVVSAIFMATWNYAVPRLAESADKTYDRQVRFGEIEYPTAMVAVILAGLLFSSGAVISGAAISSGYDDHHKGLSDKSA